jgi:nucleoside-diphosphate-sugar epimerase
MKNTQAMLNIVLTGATGYVGRALIRALAQLPAGSVCVKALVRSNKLATMPEFVECIEGSMQAIPENLFFHQPHIVIHFGIKQIDSDNSGFYETNVVGTKNLLEKCNEHTLGIIYGSTLSVQGQGRQSGIEESQAINPKTQLAKSRAEAEQLVTRYMADRNKWGINLRPRFILGKEDQHVLPGLTKLVCNGIYLGSGQQKFSIITVDDYAYVILSLVSMINEAFDKEKSPQQLALNVGYKKALSFEQIFTQIRDHLRVSNKVTRVYLPRWLPIFLKFLPSKKIQAKAVQLELVGFDHFGKIDSLQQLIGTDITEQNPLDKLMELLAK